MDIERSSTFTILYAGRSLLTPSYFLLRWTNKDTKVSTYCICTNSGNDAGPILLQVTETGAVTPDPFDAEVQLASVNYQLEVWEQTSDSNLFPPETTAEYSELVDVKAAATPTPPPVDPCLGCGGGGDLCTQVTAADPSEVVACVVANGDVPVYLCNFIATDEATADIIVECIGNADKTAEVEAILCAPCGDVEIVDQDLNVIATPACGTQYDVLVFDGIDGGVADTVFTNSIVAP